MKIRANHKYPNIGNIWYFKDDIDIKFEITEINEDYIYSGYLTYGGGIRFILTKNFIKHIWNKTIILN